MLFNLSVIDKIAFCVRVHLYLVIIPKMYTIYLRNRTGGLYRERSGSVVESLTRDRRAEPHRRHCVVSLSKNINPSLVLVQPRKTRPYITERLLMGRKESNQTNKQTGGLFYK